jgi:ABC transport system ATP-binding/permease protein
MSEEILKALMELFALILKQEGGILPNELRYVSEFLNKQLPRESVNEYLALFDAQIAPATEGSFSKGSSSPSVRDSVKIFGICKKINRTLTQEQKVVVLMRLYELVKADHHFAQQIMNIIGTVAEVFNIPSDEIAAAEQFVNNDNPENLKNPAILVLTPDAEDSDLFKRIETGWRDMNIFILHISSVDLYFLKYDSNEQLFLNGLPITSGTIYTFAKGGSVKSQQGLAIYYTDISSGYLSGITTHKISFTVENLSFNFREGETAIDNISFSVEEGKLVGILGANGSGKTTLLNLISGVQKADSGSVKINGLNIIRDKKILDGVFGFVPQDDLLIEDLTVFENLYYAACQCLNNKTKKEIRAIVCHTLSNLGLLDKKNLKVGSPLKKVISGGERKRLNIALELIREPLVLFLDEPTSGLSSRDSENMMDLLRDLTLKGKLIFSVIHQPSSDIFKMFDKVLILDQGGCMSYFGNPVDSIIYFKTLNAQINAREGECPSCGNVTPETIFNIMETHVVDEFGRYTEKRKVRPKEWSAIFNSKHPFIRVPEITEPPHKNLHRPDILKQFRIYLSRDIKSKTANLQYVMLVFLEAPVLGFILSFIIRYIPDPDSDVYVFSRNENIPIYIFMTVIVALFLGLTISADEIFRDRKILKREHFLNLSRTSYLFSKITILIFISALQAFLFIIIANPVLGIKGMYLNYWIAFFTTAFCANMLGLNISASFNSAITIYIVIPLLIIPMMVLSGAMFPFDKLNRKIGNIDKVPLIAELMPTRWTFEALMVTQFKDNRYSKLEYNKNRETFYMLQKKISEAEFNKVYRIKALREALSSSVSDYRKSIDKNSSNGYHQAAMVLPKFTKLPLLYNELNKTAMKFNFPGFRYLDDLAQGRFNIVVADSLMNYLNRLDKAFSAISNTASDSRDEFYRMNATLLKKLENDYYNYKLLEIVTKPYEREKILVYRNSFVQNTDMIYLDPERKGFPGFRTHFYSPDKYFSGIKTDTFIFNIALVLISTIFLYLTLYYELPAKAVQYFENIKFRK